MSPFFSGLGFVIKPTATPATADDIGTPNNKEERGIFFTRVDKEKKGTGKVPHLPQRREGERKSQLACLVSLRHWGKTTIEGVGGGRAKEFQSS